MYFPPTGREYLEGIKIAKQELASIEEEKAGYIALFYGISSPAPDKEKVTGGEMHGLEIKVEKIEEYKNRLNQQCEDIIKRLIQASDLISKVPDAQARLYLREYYINEHTYRQICARLFASKSTVMRAMEHAIGLFEDIYQAEILKKQ